MSRLAAFDWHLTSDVILQWVGQSLVYGSVLAVLTWIAIQIAFRRARPALHGALWLIVLLKFMLPVGPAMPFSLSSGVQSLAQFLPRNPPEIRSDPGERYEGAEATWMPVTTEFPAAATPAEPGHGSDWSPLALVAGAYLASVLLVGVARIAAFRRFAARCRKLPPADADVRNLTENLCIRMGVLRVPTVRVSDEARAPFLFGAMRSTLVLSPRQISDRGELEAVILHEIAHLRRSDMLVRYLQWLAGTMLFFWPVVAWVNRRIDLVREHACDEWALRHGPLSAGDYARTLLRAVQPKPPLWQSYCPNAMARRRSHVERRIEMILDTNSARGAGRGLQIAGILVVAAWAGIALTGAASANAPQDKTQTTQVTQELQIVVEGDNASFTPLDIMPPIPLMGMHWFGTPGETMLPGAGQTMHMFVLEADDSNDAEPRRFVMHASGVSPEALAQFGKDHPAADANADGQVNSAERDAYLVALAMRDPAAVLAKFPAADRDQNGELSAMEAAQLVQGGPMIDKMIADGPAKRFRVVVGPQAEEDSESIEIPVGEPGVKVIRLNRSSSGDAAPQEVHVRTIVNGVPNEEVSKKVALAMEDGGSWTSKCDMQPATWLVENVSAAPTAAEVARYVSVAEQAPLVTFLRLNPKADANGDGVLTQAERDSFVQENASRMRQRVLERHPEADANSDGVLTDEEMHGFFKNRSPGAGMMMFKSGDAPAGAAQVEVVVEVQSVVEEQPK